MPDGFLIANGNLMDIRKLPGSKQISESNPLINSAGGGCKVKIDARPVNLSREGGVPLSAVWPVVKSAEPFDGLLMSSQASCAFRPFVPVSTIDWRALVTAPAKTHKSRGWIF